MNENAYTMTDLEKLQEAIAHLFMLPIGQVVDMGKMGELITEYSNGLSNSKEVHNYEYKQTM